MAGSASRPLRATGAALALLAAAALLAAPPASACSSTACLASTRNDGTLAHGTFRLDVSFRHLAQDGRLSGGRRVETVTRPYLEMESGLVFPGWHEDERARERLLDVALAWGLTDRLTLHASLTALSDRWNVGSHGRVRARSGATGLGDLTLGARHAFFLGRHRLDAGLGLKLPTGDIRRTYAGSRALLEPMLQPGTGSTDVVASAAWAPPRGRRLSWAVSASHQANGANDLAYRFGSETIAGVLAARPLGARLDVSLQGKLVHRRGDAFHGGPVAATGSTVVWLVPGLRVSTPGRTAVHLWAPLPLRRHVRDAQLAPSWGAVVGLSAVLGGHAHR